MRTEKASGSPCLRLDDLSVNPALARRLSAELAWRWHALPLAEDGGRVTVAMADPDDQVAREAITTALGPEACVVRGDPAAIDSLLASIWGDQARRRLALRVCAFPVPVASEVWSYARALSDLLDADIGCLQTAGAVEALIDAEEHGDCDLVILETADHPLLHRLLLGGPARQEPTGRRVDRTLALLTATSPRWPIRNILLIVRGYGEDDAALNWAVRLARASGSAVTILAIVPPVPAMYGQRADMDPGLAGLLSSETRLGRQMRRAARWLADWEIEGTLRLRQGSPDWQIRREIIKGDYDLVALAAHRRHWCLRWLEGDPVAALLRRADRPLLITRTAPAPS